MPCRLSLSSSVFESGDLVKTSEQSKSVQASNLQYAWRHLTRRRIISSTLSRSFFLFIWFDSIKTTERIH